MKPHQQGLSQEIGKKLAPFFTKIFMHGSLIKLMQLLEIYLAIIQGKGAGTGWDIQGEVTAAVLYINRPDVVIFDVGANTGEWSVRILEVLKATDKCHIFLFEPSQHCQDILRSMKLPKVTLIEAAVGEESGSATFYSPNPGSPISSLHLRRDSYFQQYKFKEETVQVVTIDEIVDKFKIDIVDFVKIDVEGNELAVIRGAQKSMKSKCIKALSFEFGSGNINSRTYFRDFWDILHSYGYEIHRICPGGTLVLIEEYYEDLEYFRGVTNYLAVLK